MIALEQALSRVCPVKLPQAHVGATLNQRVRGSSPSVSYQK